MIGFDRFGLLRCLTELRCVHKAAGKRFALWLEFLHLFDSVTHEIHFQMLLHDEISLLQKVCLVACVIDTVWEWSSLVLFDFLGLLFQLLCSLILVEWLQSQIHDFFLTSFLSNLWNIMLLFFLDRKSFLLLLFKIRSYFLSLLGFSCLKDCAIVFICLWHRIIRRGYEGIVDFI